LLTWNGTGYIPVVLDKAPNSRMALVGDWPEQVHWGTREYGQRWIQAWGSAWHPTWPRPFYWDLRQEGRGRRVGQTYW